MAGRPTDYSPDMLVKANEYIGHTVDTADAHGKLLVRIPKAAGLALYLGVNKATLYRWAEVNDEFRDILDRINQIQEDRVMDRAMDGTYNAQIAKLLLGKHGYHDKIDTDHTTAGKPMFDSEASNKAKGAVAEFLTPKPADATEPDKTGAAS